MENCGVSIGMRFEGDHLLHGRGQLYPGGRYSEDTPVISVYVCLSICLLFRLVFACKKLWPLQLMHAISYRPCQHIFIDVNTSQHLLHSRFLPLLRIAVRSVIVRGFT